MWFLDKENENEDSDILAQYFSPISDLGEEQTTVETRPSERLVSADTVISRSPVEPTRSEEHVAVEPKLQEDDSFADMFEDWEEVGEEVAPPLAAKFNRHKIIEIDDTVNNQLILILEDYFTPTISRYCRVFQDIINLSIVWQASLY